MEKRPAEVVGRIAVRGALAATLRCCAPRTA